MPHQSLNVIRGLRLNLVSRVSAQSSLESMPALPILVGYGMPRHAEMASPVKPAPTVNLDLVSEIEWAPVITSDMVSNSSIKTAGKSFEDETLR